MSLPDGEGYLNIDIPPVHIIDEVEAYSWLNLLAEIGGYLGLCLGYSLYQWLDDIWNVISKLVMHMMLSSCFKVHISKNMQ